MRQQRTNDRRPTFISNHLARTPVWRVSGFARRFQVEVGIYLFFDQPFYERAALRAPLVSGRLEKPRLEEWVKNLGRTFDLYGLHDHISQNLTSEFNSLTSNTYVTVSISSSYYWKNDLKSIPKMTLFPDRKNGLVWFRTNFCDFTPGSPEEWVRTNFCPNPGVPESNTGQIKGPLVYSAIALLLFAKLTFICRYYMISADTRGRDHLHSLQCTHDIAANVPTQKTPVILTRHFYNHSN